MIGRMGYVVILERCGNFAQGFAQGEVDILEGVNDQASNSATLHTTTGWFPVTPIFHHSST